MDLKRKIEFIAGGMFILLLLLLILVLLYSQNTLEKEEIKKNFNLYERNSIIFLNNGIYIFEENIKEISFKDGVYYEKIYQNKYHNFENKLVKENEFFYEVTLNKEN